MEKEKLVAALRLQVTPNVGPIIAKKLIGITGGVSQIFREKKATLEKIKGIGNHITSQLFDTRYVKLAEKEYDTIIQQNTKYTYFLDEEYPKHLKNCIDAPILLFKDGNIDLTNHKIISIVGTRNSTSYGRDFCNQLIEELAIYNPIIVSGFAYGIDICAHKAAIKNKLQTIAVLAHGLSQLYPKAHKQYVNQVMNHGGLLTEFWHNQPPLRENFLKRNRIVAGISQATIVIESAETGGSLVTADIANSYNKDVFAVSGRATDMYSKGCNNLIKNHQAHLLSSSKDIIELLNWDTDKKTLPKQKRLFIELNENEQKVYEYLQQKGKQLLDSIAIDCEIPIYQLSAVLVQMELKNVIAPLPGKMFEAV